MAGMMVYAILLAFAFYFLYRFMQPGGAPSSSANPRLSRANFRDRPPKGNWVQVYETASLEEAMQIQARLEESEIECIVYEQGKVDIKGNPLRGVGVAVPKTAMSLAQNVISRIPV